MAKSEAARTFGVSLSSVKRYVSKARQGRSLSPRKHLKGHAPSSTSEPGGCWKPMWRTDPP
jgi:transposase